MRMYDNKALERIFGPNSEEVKGLGQNLTKRSLILVIKEDELAVHLTWTEERNILHSCKGQSKERDNLTDIGVDRKVILRWVLESVFK